uniref:UmuC domain-containing protein n=1 Tax=Plectus sambesii TaxID=2011161 RepID=A0A914UYL5_9BILA
MDCFYAQVEQRERPELWGKPVAVAQYVQWKGGGLIAVSYEARAAGVKRGSMRGDEAKAICPELTVCYVPMSAYGEKADLTKYRDASAEVFKVLNDFDSRIVVERASIDEAYLDLTTMVDHIMSNSRAEPIDLTLDRFPTTHIADGKDTDEGYVREDSLKSWLDRRCSEDLASVGCFY